MKISWLPSVTTWMERLSTSGTVMRGVVAPAGKPVQAKAAVAPCSRRRREGMGSVLLRTEYAGA